MTEAHFAVQPISRFTPRSDFEFENLASDPQYAAQEANLQKLLRAGPWGPWWFYHANDAEGEMSFPLELTAATQIETAVGA